MEKSFALLTMFQVKVAIIVQDESFGINIVDLTSITNTHICYIFQTCSKNELAVYIRDTDFRILFKYNQDIAFVRISLDCNSLSFQ